MTSKVADAIDAARKRGRGAFIGYLPAAFPDIDTSVAAVTALARAGADVIELGLPYSDPVMDGPVIQAASQQALAAGFRVDDVFRIIERVRAEVDVTIVCMSYFNLMLQHGLDAFARDLAAAGGAGIVTPDLIPDEAAAWIDAATRHDLDRIFLAAPTSSDERLRHIIDASRGFVYAVSTLGITGAREEIAQSARILTDRLHDLGCEHACVGLGISTPQQVREVLEYAEGAIVGSALVRALASEGVAALAETAQALAKGTEQ